MPPAAATRSSWTRRMGKSPVHRRVRSAGEIVPEDGQAVVAANTPGGSQPDGRAVHHDSDGLLVPNPFYNNYHQIVQAPGYVVIVTEMMHETRIIPLDGRVRMSVPGVRMWTRGLARPVGRPIR